MIKIQGNRVLVCTPEHPYSPELTTIPGVTFREHGPAKILIPEDNSRKVSEWEIVAIGGEGRSGRPDETLAVGQSVLIDHSMGFQAYEHEGRPCRIYSCRDILAILTNGAV